MVRSESSKLRQIPSSTGQRSPVPFQLAEISLRMNTAGHGSSLAALSKSSLRSPSHSISQSSDALILPLRECCLSRRGSQLSPKRANFSRRIGASTRRTGRMLKRWLISRAEASGLTKTGKTGRALLTVEFPFAITNTSSTNPSGFPRLRAI